MIKIGDIINKNPIKIKLGATIHEAALLASTHLVSDLMVVDEQNNFIGVLSEGDLIRAVIPNIDEIIKIREGKFQKAFSLFLANGKKYANRVIDPYVLRNIITLEPGDDLLKAATVMVTRYIRRLPVVSSKELLGTVSCAEICYHIFHANDDSENKN